jgi:small-conductance mechanosensitive channel
LPTTNLDSGMQVSFITLFGYIGGVLAVALALSAAGIGLERIAWVASALSVGIGFGLQAVVQNFVSGLILLAERPVKVGDWVSLGACRRRHSSHQCARHGNPVGRPFDGDRAELGIHHQDGAQRDPGQSLGLVQVKLPLPLGTDAQAARALILSAFVDIPTCSTRRRPACSSTASTTACCCSTPPAMPRRRA